MRNNQPFPLTYMLILLFTYLNSMSNNVEKINWKKEKEKKERKKLESSWELVLWVMSIAINWQTKLTTNHMHNHLIHAQEKKNEHQMIFNLHKFKFWFSIRLESLSKFNHHLVDNQPAERWHEWELEFG